ncbi:MAG: NAD(P)H-dependent glycerol-3-phosphate dehydrogenase [Spirochaetota bacterium]
MFQIVAVLGAGYMGSAVTFPLRQRGLEVRLWGTWLDDDIIDRCAGGPHPRLGIPLPEGVRLFSSDRLGEAVEDADAVFMAVTSEGFAPVLDRLLDTAGAAPPPVLALTKGFVSREGGVYRISDYTRRACRRRRGALPGWVSIGGPVKAVELSRRVPTATVFAGSPGMTARCAGMSTGYYRVLTCEDVTGLELCSALKNVYAIAMGICDGLYGEEPDTRYDNLKAFVFTAAVEEMVLIAEASGGRAGTVRGFGGVGDLYVTQASGRNGELGRLVGAGAPPEEAYRALQARDLVAEGYHTLQLAGGYLGTCGIGMRRLPLLGALHRIMLEGRDPAEELAAFTSGFGR